MENFDVEQARKTVENINKMEDKSFGFGTVLIFWGIAAFAVILIIGALASFPIIEFKGNEIRMFAPERILGRMPRLNEITRPLEPFNGWVWGEHVLKTNHGEITLGHFSYVEIDRNAQLFGINVENFRRGRASHRLVVNRIEIPSLISINFNTSSLQNNRRLSFLSLYAQEIIISGIPLGIQSIDFAPPRSTADVVMEFWRGDHIILADSTIITGQHLSALFMYNEDELWAITGQIFVKRPWETEFTEYRSITFRPNWGEFIEGISF